MSKPIIRHCINCKWFKEVLGVGECKVKDKTILEERISALFCRYYKERGGRE